MIDKVQPRLPNELPQATSRPEGAPRLPVSSPRGAERRPAEVTFSDDVHLLQRALARAKEAPDVRDDVVSRIRAQMEAGAYRVDHDALADRLLSLLI